MLEGEIFGQFSIGKLLVNIDQIEKDRFFLYNNAKNERLRFQINFIDTFNTLFYLPFQN